MSEGNDKGHWDEYRRLVLTEIKRLADEIRHERANARQVAQAHLASFSAIEREIAVLKVKCGMWGLMGGLIPAVTAMVMTKI